MKIHVTDAKPRTWREDKDGPWEQSDTCVTIGSVIHSNHHPLPPDVFEHEKVHVRQQLEYPDGIDAFIEKYETDQQFRYEMELEAYVVQLAWLEKNVITSPKMFRKVLTKLARDFSGPMYGLHWLKFHQARDAIKSGKI